MEFRVGCAVRSEHRRDGLPTSLGHRDARNTLNDARLFHERGIKLRWDAANHGTIVAREA
jgi:hypothetical protein